MFERLIWRDDRVLLDDLVFRLQHGKNDNWELGDDCFVFYKVKPLLDQYARFWAARPEFRPRHLLELGMWDGGSVAFWFELFQPHKHVGVDLTRREDSRYFRRYLAGRGLEQRIATHWGVDQADRTRLRALVTQEFDGPLDLVIDDASHLYAPTKASFETLFPLLRPGGLYLVEDWAWAHWPEFHAPRHPWATERPLTDLVVELVEAAGSSPALVSQVHVFQGFAAVERGPAEVEGDFALEQAIRRRPQANVLRRAARTLRVALRRRAGRWRGKRGGHGR